MKHFLIILISLLSFFQTEAQIYFPKGATWYYHAPEFSPGSFSYNLLESKGDSIFNGDTLIYLDGYINCADGYNELIKIENKKIYRLNTCDSTYTQLYNFGANTGDTIKYYAKHCNPSMQDTMIYVIDSIKPININGNILDLFYISYTEVPSPYYVGSFIIEGIGGNESFYPIYFACDPVGGPLRCYTDTIIGKYKNQYYYGSTYTGSCDTIYVGINEFELDKSIEIYPNPSSEKIFITTNTSFDYIELYTLKGQKLNITKTKEISIASYPKGIYLLKIYFKKGVVYRKVIKK